MNIFEETYKLNSGIEISAEDMKTLKQLNGMDYGAASAFPVFGGKQ